MGRKTLELHDCENCENYVNQDEPFKQYCKAEFKMTFDEYEDYFIDKVKRCTYYKKGAKQ